MGCTSSKEKKEGSNHNQNSPQLKSPGDIAASGRPTQDQKSSQNATTDPKLSTNAGPTHDNINNNNKQKDAAVTSPSAGNGNGGAAQSKADYKALRQVVLDAEEVLKSMTISDEEKELVALSFINTLSDVLRQTYRLKRESAADALDELCAHPSITIHRKVLGKMTYGAREEFLCHLITSWIARNPTGEPTLPIEAANEILHENQIVPWKKVPMRFADCYRELLRIGDNPFTNAVFAKYAEGNLTINSQQFLNFLVDCQQSDTATMKLAEEKTKERFGGVGTRFTFALYLQSLTLNTAQDPRRGGTVWQDMTQPLPQYMVRTCAVDSLDELRSSLATGSRAVVLHCYEDEKSGVVMAGDDTLDSMLHVIKDDGFVASNYPLMLCLAPEVCLTVPLQDKIAKALTNILGEEMIAKGMMFEGATIKDPKFSPAALQHRVLVLGSQAPLKPFVGFLVADMNRNGLGVKVTNVVNNTPAAKAGVQKGDWFTHINNEQITSKSHLKSILAHLKLGEEFTMRRENLDDVTIVVGGTVEGDAINSKDLSNLVFLKFTKGEAFSPWDVCEEERGEGGAPAPNSPEKEAHSREELSNHFRFTTIDEQAEMAANGSRPVTSATHSGVQLICASRDTEDQKWSRGFFADNGSCGYVQKSLTVGSSAKSYRIQLECPPPHFYNWSIAGIRGKLFGDGVIVVDEDAHMIEVSNTDDLTVCSFLVTLMPPNSSQSEASPARSISDRAVPSSPNKDKHDAIATPVVLSVSFPISILRQGIRAFASLEERDEGKIKVMPHYPILATITAISAASK